MARYGYENGWTLVTRQRRRLNYGPDRAAQQPNHHAIHQAQNRAVLSYADAVKYGRQARPITTSHTQIAPQPYRPQQAFFRPRANLPYTYESRERQIHPQTRRPHKPTQNRPRATFTRPGYNTTQQKDTTNPKRSDDPQFVPKTRALLKLIKVLHHKNNLIQGLPPSLKKMEQHLSELIRPALPNIGTQALIEGNAKNWAYTTLLILKDHYEDTLKLELDSLQNFASQEWEECFTTATQWAKRGIGRRLQDRTVHEAFTLVQKHWSAQEQTATQTSATTSAQGERLVIQAEVYSAVDLQSSLPPTPLQIKASKTVSTMTEPMNDCSPSRELDFSEIAITPLNAHISPPQTPLMPHASPKERRIPHLRPREVQPNPGVVHDLVDLSELENRPPESAPTEEQKKDRSDPPSVANLNTATQTHLTTDPSASTPMGVYLDTQGGRPIRHMSTNRKMADWRLGVRKKWLFIGDSNLARMPHFEHQDLQIDSYPGATFRHIEAVIKKTTAATDVEHVVLSLGINSRTQNAKDTTVKQMQAALRAAKQTFPAAQIWVPVINFSGSLLPKERSNLNTLNAHISANILHIPALPRSDFQTEPDNIHWTRATAESMLQHWLAHLK